MATNRTVTVKPSGGDYTSLASALANESHDLVSLNRQLTITCFPITGGDAKVTAAQFGDATKPWVTTSPSGTGCYLQIEGSADIGPTFDTAKYYLKATDADILQLGNINNLVLQDLQFQLTYTAASGTTTRSCIVGGTHATGAMTLRRLVFKAIQTGGTGALVGLLMNPGTATWTCRNHLYFGGFTYGSYWNTAASVLASFDNLSLVNCFRAAESAVGAQANVRFRNCGSSGTGGSWSNTWNTGSTNNALQSGTPPGTNPRSNVTPSFANAGASDYHLASGDTAWKDQGANLSTDFNNDIENKSRTPPWDIGASEFVGTISSFTGTGVWVRSGGHIWTGIGQHTAAGGGSRGGMLTICSEE